MDVCCFRLEVFEPLADGCPGPPERCPSDKAAWKPCSKAQLPPKELLCACPPALASPPHNCAVQAMHLKANASRSVWARIAQIGWVNRASPVTKFESLIMFPPSRDASSSLVSSTAASRADLVKSPWHAVLPASSPADCVPGSTRRN